MAIWDTWTDKRPIGLFGMASSFGGPGNTANNPHGWMWGGLADFGGSQTNWALGAISWQRTSIAHCLGMGAQGYIVWDIEGECGQQPVPDYYGDPQQGGVISPEMHTAGLAGNAAAGIPANMSVADYLFAMGAAAGLKTGVTTRSQILANVTSTPKSGTQTNYSSDAQGITNLTSKMTFCNNRWGCTMFYCDSNNVDAPGIYSSLYGSFSQFLIAAEHWGNDGANGHPLHSPSIEQSYLPYSCPYTDTNFGTISATTLGTPGFTQAFCLVKVINGTGAQMQAAAAAGDILMWAAWTRFTDEQLLVTALTNLGKFTGTGNFNVDLLAPNVPGNGASVLTVGSPTTSSLTVSWGAVTDNATAGSLATAQNKIVYLVQRNGATVFTSGSGQTSFVDNNGGVGLTANTTYSYKVQARDLLSNYSAFTTTAVNGTTLSSVPVAPSVSVSAASPIGPTTATLNGAIVSTGGSAITSDGFDYGNANGASGVYPNSIAATTVQSGSFSANLTGLTTGATYHYRSKAVNTAGTGVSGDQAFTPVIPPPFTQGATANSSGTGSTVTSIAAAFPNAQTAANSNVIIVAFGDITTTVSSVLDTKGNVYQVASPLTRSTGDSQVIYWCPSIVAAVANSNTVTVSFSAGTPFVSLRISEYSGLGSIDVHSEGSGTTATASVPSVTTTNAGDVIVVGTTSMAGLTGPAPGFVERLNNNPFSSNLQDAKPGAITSYTAPTPVAAAAWVENLVAFLPFGVLSVPTGLSASSPNQTSIQLSWTASTGGSGGIYYVVQHKGGSIGTTFVTIPGVGVTGVGVLTVTDTNLSPSTSYTYQVQAVDSLGTTTAFSAPLTSNTQSPPPPAIWNATDVSRAAVLAQITNATNSFNGGNPNNQVNIPSGSGTWSTPITITVPMIVLGAGQGTTNIHNSTSAPSGSGSETPTFIVQLVSDGRLEIGNFTITADTGGSGQPNSSNGIQLVIGSFMPTQIVIRDITFSGQDFAIYNGGNGNGVMIGVVARCTFTNIRIAARNSGYFNPARLQGFTYPSPAWGTINYFVYEDCTFNLGPNWNPFAQASYFFDTEYPMNYMVRFCTFTANRSSGVEVDGFDEHGNYNSASAVPPIIAVNNLGMVLHDNTLNILGGTSVGTQLCDVRGGVGNVIFNNTITGQANNSIKIRADPDLSTEPTQTYFANNTNPNGSQIPVNAVSGTTGPNLQPPPVLGTNYFVASGSSGIFSILPNYTEMPHPHPFLTSTPDTNPPSVPAGITSSSPNPGQINLSWTASSDPPNAASTISYIIQRALGPSGTFSPVFTTGPGVISYADGGLSQNTLYRYQIAAKDSSSNQSLFSTPPVSQTTASGSTIPAFVQEVDVDNGSTSSTTGVVIFTNQQVRGNTNLICVAWRGTATISNVHDSALNTYTSAGPVVAGTDSVTGFVRSQQIYYATNIVPFANNTLTATMSAASTNIVVRAIEYFGVSQSSPIDAISSNSGTSANPSAGPLTVSQTNDMLVGLPYAGAVVSVITAGYTQRSSGFSLVEDQLAVGTGGSGSSGITGLVHDSDGSFASTKAQLAACAPGDTVRLPQGSFVWAFPLDVNKSVTIMGAGASLTTISLSHTLPDLQADTGQPGPVDINLIRISPPAGITPTGASTSSGPLPSDVFVTVHDIGFNMLNIPYYHHSGGYQLPDQSAIHVFGFSQNDYNNSLTSNPALSQIHIYNCSFINGKAQIHIWGKVYGCIDNCTFTNGDCGVMMWGCDSDAWTGTTYNTPGTQNAMFIENNQFFLNNSLSWYPTFPSDPSGVAWAIDHQIYHQQGAKSVIRNNTMDLTAMTKASSGNVVASNFFLDIHGNQIYYNTGSFNFRGNPLVEIYNNTCLAHTTFQFLEQRGGSCICYNNHFSCSDGSIGLLNMWEEECWQTGFFNPLRTPAATGLTLAQLWPAEDMVNATFFSNNTFSNTGNTNTLMTVANGMIKVGDPGAADGGAAERQMILENRDFWQTMPSSTTFVSGGYPAVREIDAGGRTGYPNNYRPITSYTAFQYPHPFVASESSPSGFSASVTLASSVGWVMHLVALKSAGADTIAPSVPGSPSAVGASQSSITISWTTSTDNIDANLSLVYPIEYTGGGVSSFTQISPIATGVASGTDTFTHTGLTASTTYTYRMRAQDTSGNLSGYTSPNFTGTTLSPDTTPPNAPSGLTATAVSSSQINLAWNASSDPNTPTNQITYLIERQLASGGLFNQVGVSAAPSNLTFPDTGLQASTAYNYRIRAEDPSLNLSGYFPSVAPYPTDTTFAALANIAPVQNGSGLQAVTGTTCTKVFTSAQTAGYGNIVTLSYPNTVTVTVADNTNGPYALAASFVDNGQGYTLGVYYLTGIKAAAANANTVTATFSASIAAGASSIHISEWSNMATYRPVEAVISGAGSGNTANSGTLTTLHANDLLYGVGLPANNFSQTPGTGYTLLSVDNNGVIDEYQIVSTAGSYSATGTITAGGAWTMGLVAFKSTANVLPAFAYPLKVSSNSRYLVDQNNAPFLMFSDTVWPIVTNLSLSDVDVYLSNRAKHGFNCIMFSIFAGVEIGGPGNMVTVEGFAPFNSGTTTFQGTGPFSVPPGHTLTNTYNLTATTGGTSANYFNKVKSIISMAASYGMTVVLDPIENYGWCNPDGSGNYPFVTSTSTVCSNFGKFLGTTFAGFPNLIWSHGNDYQNYPAYDTNLLAIVNGIKSTDTTTPHIHTMELRYTTSLSTDDANWISALNLNLVYTYYPSYAESYIGYNFSPTKPAFLGETVYEASTSTAVDDGSVQVYRRQTLWAYTSGAVAGYQSGAGNWFLGNSPSWKTLLDSPAVSDVPFILSILQANNWQNLVPDTSNTFITTGKGTQFPSGNLNPASNTRGLIPADTFVTASVTADGTFGIAYAPVATTLTVAMTKMSGPVTAQWMDPSNGVKSTVSGSPFPNTGTRNFATPGTTSDGLQDWVLTLTASAASTQTVTLLGIPSGEAFGSTTPPPVVPGLGSYTLVFQDEFNDLSAIGPNTGRNLAVAGRKWVCHTPYNGDFGTAFFTGQSDTDADGPGLTPPNPFSVSNSILSITTYHDATINHDRTGFLGSLDENGIGFSVAQGYFEMRAKLPSANGCWSAFWLLSSGRIAHPPVSSNFSEIDIFEIYGGKMTIMQSVVDVWSSTSVNLFSQLQNATIPDASAAFHVYSCLINPDFIHYYFDGVQVNQVATHPENLLPHYVMVDLAQTDAGLGINEAALPQVMQVDYVRVWSPVSAGSGIINVRSDATINLSGIVSSETFGNLRVDAPSTVTLSGIQSAQAISGLSISGTGNINITLSGIPSAGAFGTTRVDAPATVTLSGIPSAGAISGLRVDAPATIFISGILSLASIGNIQVQLAGDQSVTLSGITSAESLSGLSISGTGTATITLSGIASAEVFGRSVMQGPGPQFVILFGIPGAESFGSNHVIRSGGPARMARVL